MPVLQMELEIGNFQPADPCGNLLLRQLEGGTARR
jgi:hypothetical protein